jgi:hypothetical protein
MEPAGYFIGGILSLWLICGLFAGIYNAFPSYRFSCLDLIAWLILSVFCGGICLVFGPLGVSMALNDGHRLWREEKAE